MRCSGLGRKKERSFCSEIVIEYDFYGHAGGNGRACSARVIEVVCTILGCPRKRGRPKARELQQMGLNDATVLNSRKEIARYLNRGVRTVQRCEAYKMPVHRVGLGHRPPVFAFSKELDAWLQKFAFLTNHPARRLRQSNATRSVDLHSALHRHFAMIEKLRSSGEALASSVAASRASRQQSMSSWNTPNARASCWLRRSHGLPDVVWDSIAFLN